MQRALDKYGKQGFVVLSINNNMQEDDMVADVMKPYGFVPLRVPEKNWSRVNYNVTMTPVNHLVDAEGRVVFQPRVGPGESEAAFFAEIEGLLRYAAATVSRQ